jgi:hypothetical protein
MRHKDEVRGLEPRLEFAGIEQKENRSEGLHRWRVVVTIPHVVHLPSCGSLAENRIGSQPI